MLESPCKPDCPERSPTCHGECDRYFAFEICNESERNTRFREKELDNDLFKSSRHYKKKKRRRSYLDGHGDF